MAVTVEEVKGSHAGSLGVAEEDVARVWLVDAGDGNDGYRSPYEASRHPEILMHHQLGVPGQSAAPYVDPSGVTHNELVAKDVDHDYVHPSRYVTRVTVTYGYREGTLRRDIVRRRWTIGTRSIRKTVSLDEAPHNIIGSQTFKEIWETRGDPGALVNVTAEYGWPQNQDPDAEIGKEVLIPEMYFDMAFPKNVWADPTTWPAAVARYFPYVTKVHGPPGQVENFQGHPGGTLQYLGFEADEVGPLQNDFQFTHHWRAGFNRIERLPGSGEFTNIDLAHDWFWTWKLVDGSRVPLEGLECWLYEYDDFNEMFL